MIRKKLDILAIIPARGGSKGIPGKNILPVCGKPLLAWTIEAANNAESVTRVVVSTDSPDIEWVALEYGAEVVRRPRNISGDSARSEDALLHTLETLRNKECYEPDLVVFLQCTSPLTLGSDIDNTVNAMLINDADTALAVTDFHYFLWRNRKDGSATAINHDKSIRKLRQEKEPQYLETGAVYVMNTQGFLEAKHRFFGKTVTHCIPAERCMEIDTPTDLTIAEHMLREQQTSRKQSQPNRKSTNRRAAKCPAQ